MPDDPDAAGAALSPFARTADVIEEVAEWAGVHPAVTLMAMRGVSGVWRGAVSSALRRMAAHEDEGWASASRVSGYVAAKPVVVRLCVAIGGEWLRELPYGAFVPPSRAQELPPPQPTAEPDTAVSPHVAYATDVFRQAPLLTLIPMLSLHTAADAEALFSALSAHCQQLRTLAVRLWDAGGLPPGGHRVAPSGHFHA